MKSGLLTIDKADLAPMASASLDAMILNIRNIHDDKPSVIAN
ncbi:MULTISPECIES: urease accessory protein UreG [Burkholderiaceae]|nr:MULTISPECIES: urease accessory protein UreG [Burkholderiaceae]